MSPSPPFAEALYFSSLPLLPRKGTVPKRLPLRFSCFVVRIQILWWKNRCPSLLVVSVTAPRKGVFGMKENIFLENVFSGKQIDF
ncbi:hypothetical protein H5410_012699 [Solanum commersonii]|uniref:Uncharacterized protein n=1 Tax=Solanum commersonii TaxID=4109 RepID=A0A9J6AT34_SOLCO|nr:hypothetical protein H5410_012699 [Solanum commersonii]